MLVHVAQRLSLYLASIMHPHRIVLGRALKPAAQDPTKKKSMNKSSLGSDDSSALEESRHAGDSWLLLIDGPPTVKGESGSFLKRRRDRHFDSLAKIKTDGNILLQLRPVENTVLS